MIELKNISIGYDKSSILLKDFSYKFDDGITYGILGESGCGKTTLLRTIAGLKKPLYGEVLEDEIPMKKAGKNDVYMMHQNYTSFDWLRVIDNVLISREVKNRITDDDIADAERMLESVGLLEYVDRFPKELSGGQRQRLALARTLYANPRVILMDEPLSALDYEIRKRMQNLVMKHSKETKCTIIMVTHSKSEADLMCDKIIDLNRVYNTINYEEG